MGESHTSGTAQFIAENIIGILRAIPHRDGSYADVCQKAEEQGVSMSPYTISYWVNSGQGDTRKGYHRPAMPGSPLSMIAESSSSAAPRPTVPRI